MPEPVEISREETEGKGRYLHRSGGAVAEMTFSKAGERLRIIDHTEVPPEFRGRGIGEALVARAVEDARAEGRSILPLCPFAAAQFRRHPDWTDVLEARVRPRK